MKKIVMVRGAPGSGKSSFLKVHGLIDYTLSMDQIRLLLGAPIMNKAGNMSISAVQNAKVYDLFYDLMEARMSRGETLAIEAQFKEISMIKSILLLADKYRYNVLCADFSGMDKKAVLQQNKGRVEVKRVPDAVIESFYKDMPNLSSLDRVRNFKKIEITNALVQSQELKDWLNVPVVDLSHFSKVVHIGDIQGCLTPLITNGGICEQGLQEDVAYIFTGDLLDRGVENGLVLKWFIDNAVARSNVFLLYGNHETHLDRWSRGLDAISSEFEFNTLPQVLEQGITQEEVLNVIEKSQDVLHYHYQGRNVLVSHGGLSQVPSNLGLIASEQYITGTGEWEFSVDKRFESNAPQGWYQVHGHRNHGFAPIQATPRSFCLEGGVEGGGEIRVAMLDAEGWSVSAYKNPIFKPYRARISAFHKHLKCPWIQRAKNITLSEEAWATMSNHEEVHVKGLGDTQHISALNFSRNVFFKRSWDDVTVKARGLFVNNETREIVSRGYDKFFNINEMPETTLESLEQTLQYPITLFVKENGFLGNVGYDAKKDELFIASKSTNTGEFSDMFKNIFDAEYSKEVQEGLRRYLRDQEASMVFEVIDPENDPHMIAYDRPKVVLLDIFHRSQKAEKVPYEQLETIAKHFGMTVKRRGIVFKEPADFNGWFNKVESDLNYKFRGENVEGFVIEDGVGFHTKVKLPFYSFWKSMRREKDLIEKTKQSVAREYENQVARIVKANGSRAAAGVALLELPELAAIEKKQRSKLKHPLADLFVGWCLTQSSEVLQKNIIQVREIFLKEVPMALELMNVPYNPYDNEEDPVKKMHMS